MSAERKTEMLYKKERTMDVYATAGAYARLFKLVGHKMIHAMGPVISMKDLDKLIDLVQYRFGQIVSRADSQLFQDHPELGHEGTHVFYGDPTLPARDELDAKVCKQIEEIVRALLNPEPKPDPAELEEEYKKFMAMGQKTDDR